MKQLKNYLSILSMLIALSLLTFISCTPDTEKEDIICKVSVISSEGGIGVSSLYEVISGEEVTLKAVPEVTYRFVNWTVNEKEVSKENPYTTTITQNTQFIANFREIYKPTGTENWKDLVDLGLPSGLKWATCNVGATTPEEYGDYFAWGETQPKDYYYWNTYKYCNGSDDTMTKYCSYGIRDYKTTLELTDDAARVNWGGKWRMPTNAEQDELRDTDNCTWTWTTQKGVKGYKVTSKKNGNSIFLPAAGYRSNDNLICAGIWGSYWSSSLSSYSCHDAYSVFFSSSYVNCSDYSRHDGRSVRAVCK